MEKSKQYNVLTVDLEEWFHGLEPDQKRWPDLERRCRFVTEILLAVFRQNGIKATFFVLGDVAKMAPDLVKLISDDGHEIGSHGMNHQFIYKQKPEEFRQDLRESIDALSSIVNKKVKSFRAPFFSITKDSYWALEILRDEGIKYDSSIFPVRNPRYGIPNASRMPCQIIPGLFEWPVATLPSPIGNIPVGGGFYFRFWPISFTLNALRKIEKRNEPFLLYFHPWEFDPQHPRFRSKSRFSDMRHYFRLDKTLNRLQQLLGHGNFTTLAQGFKEFIPGKMSNN